MRVSITIEEGEDGEADKVTIERKDKKPQPPKRDSDGGYEVDEPLRKSGERPSIKLPAPITCRIYGQ